MNRTRHAIRARWRKRNEDINLSRVMRLNNYRELRALRNGPFATHEFMSMAGVLCRTDLNAYYDRLAHLIRVWCADPSSKDQPISKKQMMTLHERRA